MSNPTAPVAYSTRAKIHRARYHAYRRPPQMRKITSQKNRRTGEDVTYQYDQLERLIAASTTAGPQSWGLSWSYDGFGNRLAQSVTQGSGPAHSVLVNASTNRISSAGFSYDPNGNLTAMPQTGGGTLNLTYDLSNRVTHLAHNGWSEDYLYSPDNRRIWRSAGQTFCAASIDNDQQLSWNPGTGASTQYILYSPGGQKLGVYCLNFSPSGQYNVWTASEENVYWGSRLVAKRIGVGPMGHFVTDRLHSKGDGSAFYPYGESKTARRGTTANSSPRIRAIKPAASTTPASAGTAAGWGGLRVQIHTWLPLGVSRIRCCPLPGASMGMLKRTRSDIWIALALIDTEQTRQVPPHIQVRVQAADTYWVVKMTMICQSKIILKARVAVPLSHIVREELWEKEL